MLNAGNYIRYDLNMPKSLPKRKGGPSDFSRDSPLTVQGHFQSKLLGRSTEYGVNAVFNTTLSSLMVM